MATCCSHPPGTAGAPTEARPVEWLRLGVAAVVAGQSMIVGMAITLSPPDPATRVVPSRLERVRRPGPP